MNMVEGRGFLLHYSADTPFRGWIPASQLDALAPVQTAPEKVIQAVAELVQLFPGGLSLLWDLPFAPLRSNDAGSLFWSVLSHMPGLTLHMRDPIVAEFIDKPIRGWFHSALPPTGKIGQVWRQGWIGWVPESGPGWSLPGVGRPEDALDTQERTPSGCLWGEVILPLGALKELDARDLLPLLGDTQAVIEQNLSLRLNAHAWSTVFPFQRRRTGWRLSILGGREYLSANGIWEDAATRLRDLAGDLGTRLKCSIQLGASDDAEAAALLGRQAMREGHPWCHTLPIPPASPTFTPGLGADPRDAAPLESRVAYPEAMVPLLSHPPVVLLRVPHVPQESSVSIFLRGLKHIPAIRWIPPEIPPPGPFMLERPWAPASAYTPLADVTLALQPRLFEEPDPGANDQA